MDNNLEIEINELFGKIYDYNYALCFSKRVRLNILWTW